MQNTKKKNLFNVKIYKNMLEHDYTYLQWTIIYDITCRLSGQKNNSYKTFKGQREKILLRS